MTLLINGCSFFQAWEPSEKFKQFLGTNKYDNIYQVATGVQRLARSTVEYVASKQAPRMVILGLPFVHRWELAIGKKDVDIDGTWYAMQVKDFIDHRRLSPMVAGSDVEKLSEYYYRCLPDIRTFWDKAFTEIILLCSFLDSKRIPYVLFDMCNNFDESHIKHFKGFEKIKLIKDNPNIIDIFNFCGNSLMYDNLDDKNGVDPYSYHHKAEQFRYLEDYLIDYIKSCKII